MMMNLLILKVLTRNQVVNLKTTFKGNTAKGRLFKEFFVTEGLCRDGFYFSEIGAPVVKCADHCTGIIWICHRKEKYVCNISAGSLIIAIPFIIYFIVTQKTLITSLSGAAVKE